MFILNYISVLINATTYFFQQLTHLCVNKVHNPQVHINIPKCLSFGPQLSAASVLAALSNSVVKLFLCPDRGNKLNTFLLNLLSVHTL